MKRYRDLIVVAAVASLAACSTVMPTAQSGFLSDYSALAGAPDEATASRPSADTIDPARVSIDAVSWRVPGSADISAEEREALLTQLRSELQRHLRALPAQPQGRPAVLRAAITRVETVSPALNLVSALVLTVPLDRGGAAVEIEAVDPQTGRQLAALTLGYFAPLSKLKARFSKLAAADLAVRKAAADFVPLLQPAPVAGKQTALRGGHPQSRTRCPQAPNQDHGNSDETPHHRLGLQRRLGRASRSCPCTGAGSSTSSGRRRHSGDRALHRCRSRATR